MKIKNIVVTALFASVACIGQVYAQDINRTIELVTVTDDEGGFNAFFGDTFAAKTSGMTFSDLFTFTVASDFDSAGSVTSSYLDSSRVKDLLITGFSLYRYDAMTSMITGDAIAGVNQTGSGPNATDSWSLSAFGLSTGSYALKVDGTVVGNGGGAFGGDLTVAAVPEPETYGMLLAGLGLVGYMARRRKAALLAA